MHKHLKVFFLIVFPIMLFLAGVCYQRATGIYFLK